MSDGTFTARQLEAILRAAGVPRRFAVAVISRGYRAAIQKFAHVRDAQSEVDNFAREPAHDRSI